MTLVYPWWERWGDLRLRPYSGPVSDFIDMMDMAAWFIDEHADVAEPFGWRPVHLLHPRTGLARRWRRLHSPALAIREQGLFARWHPRTEGLSFVYRPLANGIPSILFGQEREEALAEF